MRNSLLWVTATCALMAGCSGGNQTPTSSGIPGPALPGASAASVNLGSTFVKGDLTQTASAKYSLSIDPGTLSASIQLVQSRNAQKNDDLYDLSVDAFFGPGSIVVDSINGDGTTIDVGLKVTHPFNAPSNLSGPATAGNRADLGVATRLLFLAEAPGGSPTYFAGTDDVVTNTGLLSNADGFLNPGGMIDATGLTANAFPFKNVVDEVADNRIGISNGGSPTGNYSPTDGWTQSTMGAGNNGWTGYGVLHQGQSAIVTASFDVAALNAAGGYQLDVSPIVHYNDPRQGANAATKRANRLPPATPDSTKFGYRMPHGAFDIESVRDLGETGGLIANAITATDVRFHVVDWDARATESAETNLSLDPVMSNVAQGESGVPTVEVDVPGVISSPVTLTLSDDDSGVGGDVDQDSGAAGDALFYSGTLTNTGTGQSTSGETAWGLLKASDIEANASFNDGWRFALNPSLAPLTSGIPEPIVYQAFPLDIYRENAAPTASSTTVSASVGNGGNSSVTVTGLSDLDQDVVDVLVDWDDNGTYTLSGSYSFPYTSPITLNSPITYTYSGPGTDTRNLPVRFSDGPSQTDVTPTPTFVVTPCAADGLVSSAITDMPFFFNSQWGTSLAPTQNTAENRMPGDWAVMRAGTTNALRGVVHQRLHVPPVVEYAEIHRNTAAFGQASTQTVMTSFGTQMFGQHIHQLEVDSTNRVLFAHKTGDTTQGAPASTIYPAGTGAAADIKYFDYSGAVVPWASVQTISTGGNRVVAMALDQSDNVWMIDTNNILHKYLKTSAYAEDTSGGLPLDLKGAPYNLTLSGAGATDCRIHDFLIDWRTNATLILYQTREAAGSPGNGYVLRLDCDLSKPATVAGNPNPLRFILSDSTTQSYPVDITIDQINTSGAAAPSLQTSQQILISGTTASAALPDWYIIDTNLFTRFSRDVAPFGLSSTYGCKMVVNVHNNLQHSWGNSAGGAAVAYAYYYKHGEALSGTNGSPPGWQ